MVGLGLEGLFSLSDSGSVDELKAVLLRLVSHKRSVATGAARGAASLSRPWSGVRRRAGKAQAHPRFFQAPAEGGERGWSRLGGPCSAARAPCSAAQARQRSARLRAGPVPQPSPGALLASVPFPFALLATPMCGRVTACRASAGTDVPPVVTWENKEPSVVQLLQGEKSEVPETVGSRLWFSYARVVRNWKRFSFRFLTVLLLS